MDKKTYLCRYHNLLEKIQKKKEYIAFCDERASSIPGQDFTTPRVDHTPSYEAPFVKWIIKAADAKRELETLEEQCGRVKAEIETAISKLGDEDLQMVLIFRYKASNSKNEFYKLSLNDQFNLLQKRIPLDRHINFFKKFI